MLANVVGVRSVTAEVVGLSVVEATDAAGKVQVSDFSDRASDSGKRTDVNPSYGMFSWYEAHETFLASRRSTMVEAFLGNYERRFGEPDQFMPGRM